MEYSERQFEDMVNAMETVATLPHDESFINFIHDNCIQRSVVYRQDDDIEPFCVDLSLLETMSRDDFGRTILTISGLSLESNTLNETTFMFGTAVINQTHYAIAHNSSDNNVRFFDTNSTNLPPAATLSSGQFKELLLRGIIANHGTNVDMNDILDIYEHARSKADQLPALIYSLGSINGEATQKTTALVHNGDDILAARLTERETPSISSIGDTLSLYDDTELYIDTTHLVKQYDINVLSKEALADIEYALRGLKTGTASDIPMELSMDNSDILDDGFMRYESSGNTEQARTYAQTCIKFLKAYSRAKRQKKR